MALGLSPDEMVEVWRTREAVRAHRTGDTSTSVSSCDDGVVLPDGTPTGVVRASFGYGSRPSDAAAIADFVAETFVDAGVAGSSMSSVSRTPVSGTWDVEIDRLYIYPIKSCRPQRATSWPVDASGSMAYDRRWKLVDDSGVVLTVKRCPLLARVAPTVDLSRRVLRIEMAGASIEEALDVFREEATGSSSVSKCSAWLSKRLGVPCTLVHAAPGRGDNFSNQSHVLAMHAEDIRRVHVLSGVGGDVDVFATRMRPNVILKKRKDVDIGHDHDDGHDDHDDHDHGEWSRLSCESDPTVRAEVVRPCARCDRVCIDPNTGYPDGGDKSAVLRSIIATTRGAGSERFMTLGVLAKFDDRCELSEGLALTLTR